MEPRPFLHERLPDLARELEQCLIAEGENFLAGSIQTLRIYSSCECSDITCGSFYTGPKPDGAFGPGHRSIPLDPTKGMTILDVVDDVIRYVELIDRPDIYEALHSSSNLATKPLLLLDIDGVLSPFGGCLPPGFVREGIGSHEVIWSQQHQEWLFQLGQDFELVWATTWEHSANESMSVILGLGQLDVIEFDRGTGDTSHTSQQTRCGRSTTLSSPSWVSPDLGTPKPCTKACVGGATFTPVHAPPGAEN